MSTHIASIVAYATASGSGLSGMTGPWLDVAPDKSTPSTTPYYVLHDMGGRIHRYVDNSNLRPLRIRFDIVALEADYATLQTALHARFDNASITASGSSLILSAVREDDYARYFGRDKNNKAVYVATSIYRFEVENHF